MASQPEQPKECSKCKTELVWAEKDDGFFVSRFESSVPGYSGMTRQLPMVRLETASSDEGNHTLRMGKPANMAHFIPVGSRSSYGGQLHWEHSAARCREAALQRRFRTEVAGDHGIAIEEQLSPFDVMRREALGDLYKFRIQVDTGLRFKGGSLVKQLTKKYDLKARGHFPVFLEFLAKFVETYGNPGPRFEPYLDDDMREALGRGNALLQSRTEPGGQDVLPGAQGSG